MRGDRIYNNYSSKDVGIDSSQKRTRLESSKCSEVGFALSVE